MVRMSMMRWIRSACSAGLAVLATLLLLATTAGAQTPGSGVEYLHVDALGSVRVVTDATGAVISRHDYLPYGEEVPEASRAGIAGYNAGVLPAATQRFTGKERDAETGLDYFGARYYFGGMGRFLSVDPSAGSVSLVDPQTWNRFTYAKNSPFAFVDPDGRIPVLSQLASPAQIGGRLQAANIQALIPAFTSARVNPFAGAPQAARHGSLSDVRYVRATNVPGGFIDMQHFLAAAAGVHSMPRWLGSLRSIGAEYKGYQVEREQMAKAQANPSSMGAALTAFSFEDIPSNHFGAYFGNHFYDPSKDLGPQVQAFLEWLGGMSPQEFQKQFPAEFAQMVRTEKDAERRLNLALRGRTITGGCDLTMQTCVPK